MGDYLAALELDGEFLAVEPDALNALGRFYHYHMGAPV